MSCGQAYTGWRGCSRLCKAARRQGELGDCLIPSASYTSHPREFNRDLAMIHSADASKPSPLRGLNGHAVPTQAMPQEHVVASFFSRSPHLPPHHGSGPTKSPDWQCSGHADTRWPTKTRKPVRARSETDVRADAVDVAALQALKEPAALHGAAVGGVRATHVLS